MLTAGPKPTDGPDNECETENAQMCATTTSYGTSHSNAATITTTTEILSTCATIHGCKARDSSTTTATTGGCSVIGTVTGSACESAIPTYVVYPKNGTDEEQLKAISALLEDHVDNSGSVKASDTKTLGLNFWLLPLNVSSAGKIRFNNQVRITEQIAGF